jgi:PAS domain-containing protein
VVPENIISIVQFALITLCGVGLLATIANSLSAKSARRFRQSRREEAPLVMLFEKGLMIHANRDATKLLGGKDLRELSWAHVRAVLSHRIASIPISLGKVDEPIRVYPDNARSGELRATLEQWDNFAKLSIYNWPTQNPKKAGVRVPVNEFESLSNAAMDSPFPIWRMSEQGNIIWANPAFFKEIGNRARIGDNVEKLKIQIPTDLKSGDSFRASFHSRFFDKLRHFDVTMVEHENSMTYFAVSADKAVQADEARKNFIRTLSKTFAQLSTGLAIFDKDRRLILFNPALMDQFELESRFLSAQPTLNAFFDKLREDRKIPEPRNYGSWRERIMHLVIAASDDRYREIWPLPSGETYRVTGRPHPNGAVAFLFEDISAELSLERRFRAQLDMTKAVINNLEPAIAVISPGGSFSMTNAAFRDMWRVDPDSSIANFTWVDFEKIWQLEVKESHILTMIGNYLRLFHERNSWTRDIALETGEILRVQADPVMGGYTILTFTRDQAPAKTGLQKLSVV